MKATDPHRAAEESAAVRALGAAVARLRELGIVRSANVTGDLAEWYVAGHLPGERPGPGTPGFDVISEDGRRVQVKAMGRSARHAIFLGSLDFDDLAVVVMDGDFGLEAIYLLDRQQVEAWVAPHNGRFRFNSPPGPRRRSARRIVPAG